ncbi:MAG: glycosyltransferase family 1 protein, partial [Deltaproteobacteria bacterium]|nr:glycosyltransferase family 1 protein [Deltaproteobacteria bacterium]
HLLSPPRPAERARRAAWAGRFTWEGHARRVREAYAALGAAA